MECADDEVFIRRNRTAERPQDGWSPFGPGATRSTQGPAGWRAGAREKSTTHGPWVATPGDHGDVPDRTRKDLPNRGGERREEDQAAFEQRGPTRRVTTPAGDAGGMNITIPNLAAAAAAATAGRPAVMPAQYDGSTDLDEFMAHFRLCVQANRWDEPTAGMYLGISLRGNARRLLAKMPLGGDGRYMTLVEALEQRFQPKNQADSHKALFRNRDRRPDKDLYAYSERLERLARLGYPEADADTIVSLAKDRFLDGLKDNQLRYFILYSQPRTPEDAVTVGVRAEAHLAKDRESGRKGDRDPRNRHDNGGRVGIPPEGVHEGAGASPGGSDEGDDQSEERPDDANGGCHGRTNHCTPAEQEGMFPVRERRALPTGMPGPPPDNETPDHGPGGPRKNRRHRETKDGPSNSTDWGRESIARLAGHSGHGSARGEKNGAPGCW